MLTLKQWQTPNKHAITTRYLTTNTTPCFECHALCNEAIHGNHHTQCTSKTFCISCWDEESWDCPDCHQIPDDKDCISCNKCGQWTHNHCNGMHIDATTDYLCNRCKYAGDIIDKLVLQNDATKLTNELAEKEATSQHKREIAKLSKQHEVQVVKLNKKHDQVVVEKMHLQGELQNTQASLLARSETVKEMKVLASEKNKAIRQLNVANSRNRSGNQEIHFLNKQVTELKKQLTRAQNNGKKNNKRSRECDHMLEDMQRLVKKYRARWNYNPPSTLTDIDLMLWKTYRCKTDGSSFSSDKLLCHGIPPMWKSLQQTLGEVKTYHIQSTMENKK